MHKETFIKEIEPIEKDVHVYDELDSLQEVAVWGKPGVETVLGQLYPEYISLFFHDFDVVKARKEFQYMEKLMQNEGVKTLRVKDAFVEVLRKEKHPHGVISLKKLSQLLKRKAHQIHGEFRDKRDPLKYGFENLLDWIDEILTQDAQEYGEEEAVKLNYELCLKHPLPLANILYGRDQSNVFGNSLVLSKMRWGIRTPEVGVYHRSYSQMGFRQVRPITAGYIEGGDGMMLNNICYIGVGVRTSRQAVFDLYAQIGDLLEEQGIQMVAVTDEKLARMSLREAGPEMEAMHWDTWVGPLTRDTLIGCGDEIVKRKAERITRKNGHIYAEKLGGFGDFLGKRGYNVINISKEEQRNYATNYLHLGGNKIIVPLSKNKNSIEEMARLGIKVIPAEIEQLVGGYGAVHCMTASLTRNP